MDEDEEGFTAEEIQNAVFGALETYVDDEEFAEDAPFDIDGIKTFEAAMLLTSDKGIVITDNEGGEWQLTIVRSR